MTPDQQNKLVKAINLIGEGRPHSASQLLRKLLEEVKSNPFTQHWKG